MPLPLVFPVARYRFQFIAEQPVQLPDYAGSALRGVFGHALRAAACVTGLPDCSPCALYRSCPYPAIFETPPPLNYPRRKLSNIPQPFVVEPPPWGESSYPAGSVLSFDSVLIGPALQQMPLLLLAWRHALQRGLGPQQGRARLTQLWLEGDAEPLLGGGSGSGSGGDNGSGSDSSIGGGSDRDGDAASAGRWALRPHPQSLALPPPEAAPASVSLHFSTPLRLQRDGQVLGAGHLTPRDLLMALLRRTAQLVELQLGSTLDVDFAALNAHASTVTGEHQLVWRDWSRNSSRQQQRMVLGGLVGRWTLRGDLAPFWPLLHLGQWLHVGKNTTFGLGRYHLEPSA